MMLTRAFLLLLAMMTGLSTAQAAENVRAVQGAPGLTMTVASQSVAPTLSKAHRCVSEFVSVRRIDHFDPETAVERIDLASEMALAPRTYRADRARE
jgi:hypothetical protein